MLVCITPNIDISYGLLFKYRFELDFHLKNQLSNHPVADQRGMAILGKEYCEGVSGYIKVGERFIVEKENVLFGIEGRSWAMAIGAASPAHGLAALKANLNIDVAVMRFERGILLCLGLVKGGDGK